LNDIRSVFGNAEEMFSKSILQALHEMAEAPWSDLKGKPLDERGLANRLRQYGVRSKTVRIGAVTLKGYARADLADLWVRYLSSAACASVTSVTSVTQSAKTREGPRVPIHHRGSRAKASDVTDVTDVTLHEGVGRTCAHCHQNGGSFCVASVAGEPIWLHVNCKDEYSP
jgi:hypothetical protein